MTDEVLPAMLTAVDVQVALGGSGKISMKTIRRRARDGTIPGVKWIGKKLYFQRLVVTAWIEGSSVGQARVISLGARQAG